MNTKQVVTLYQKLCNKEYVFYSTLVSKEVKNSHKTSKKNNNLSLYVRRLKTPTKQNTNIAAVLDQNTSGH